MKKLVFLVLTSILLLSLSMPGAAVAADGERFTAVASLVITDAGTMVPEGGLTRTTGEKIEGGIFSAKEWEELKDARISITHNSVTRIDWATGAISLGEAQGTFEIVKTRNSRVIGTISGRYRSKIGGNLYTGFSDAGTWNLVKSTGIYAHTRASGTLDAFFTWDPVLNTHVGQATFRGVYGERSD